MIFLPEAICSKFIRNTRKTISLFSCSQEALDAKDRQESVGGMYQQTTLTSPHKSKYELLCHPYFGLSVVAIGNNKDKINTVADAKSDWGQSMEGILFLCFPIRQQLERAPAHRFCLPSHILSSLLIEAVEWGCKGKSHFRLHRDLSSRLSSATTLFIVVLITSGSTKNKWHL